MIAKSCFKGLQNTFKLCLIRRATVIPALIDLIWAAGFLDGEGSFHMEKGLTRGKYLTVRSFIKANQAVFPTPIEKLHELFGGTFKERKARTSTGKRVYEWQVTSNADVSNTLTKLLPFLVVKKPLAELQLELTKYQGNRFGRGGNPNGPARLRIYDSYARLKAQYNAQPEV